MKLLLSMLACLVGVAGARAGAPDFVPASVRTDLQIVSLPPAAALRMIPQWHDPARSGAAWTELQGMLGRNEATLLGWPIVLANSEDPQNPILHDWMQFSFPGGSQSVQEYRYPTEFTPPDAPSIIPISQPRVIGPAPAWRWDNVPTAFDTRNLGSEIELRSVECHSDNSIVVRLRPGYSWFLRLQQFPLGPSLSRISGLIEQPEFAATRAEEFGVTMQSGTRILLTANFFTKPEPHAVLTILHAVATRPPPGTFPAK